MLLSILGPGAVVALALAIWIQMNWRGGFTIIDPHPSFENERIDLPSPDGKDPLLVDVEHIMHGVEAPESGFRLGDDGDADEWIWSTGNGDLLRVNFDTITAAVFAHTGETHDDCGAPEMEIRCGRPLGLLKLPPEDHVRYQRYLERKDGRPLCLVADAYKGLLLVSSTGTIVPLLTSVAGKPLFFANALARARNGIVYLSDTSSRYRCSQGMLESFESRPTGRVVSWNPDTEASLVVADNLPFPNGLALRNDDKGLLVALSTRFKIVEIDLTKPPNGDAEDGNSESSSNSSSKTHTDGAFSSHGLFAALPGIPDNLRVSYSHEWGGRYVLWVGMPARASEDMHFLNRQPMLRKALAMLPRDILDGFAEEYGVVLALDPDTGSILHAYQDPTGTTPFIAGIHFDDSHAYIASYKNRFLARIPRAKWFSVDAPGMLRPT